MRTLVIGAGFVGTAIAQQLIAEGDEAVVASRHRPALAQRVPWVALDVMQVDDLKRAFREVAPDAVVLVHGPSDVTWCEAHPQEAWLGHVAAAEQVVNLAGNRRVVMISTDNVFDGREEAPDETARVCPANAYGRAKLAAEQAILRAANATVERVSLIYGWEPADSAKWLNFFASCAHKLQLRQKVTAPYDQWSTPVLLEDVAEVTLALLRAPQVPDLLHVGGPERISRAAWATLIADRLKVAPDLVLFEPRAAGRYASRPPNSGLSSCYLQSDPSTAGLRVRGVREGTTLLVERHMQSNEVVRG